MTCTTELPGIADFLFADRAKREVENRTSLRVGLQPDLPAVRLDDRPRDRKADAHSLALGGDEWLEQLRRDFLGNSRPGVGNADRDHVVIGRAGGNDQLAAMRCLHGVDRIAYQVDQDLLHLHPVGEHQARPRVEPKCDPHSLLLGADERQRARLLDEFGDAFYPPLSFPRETKSRSRRMIWPARSACSAALSSAPRKVFDRSSGLPASRRCEPFT